jgi:hypothetical protein
MNYPKNRGSRAVPAHGLRSHHHATVYFPIHTRRGSCLHGADFPQTLMRGSPDGAVEPDRHRQETLKLAAKRE